ARAVFFICSASTALPPFRGFVLLSFCTRLSLACDYIIEQLLYNVKHNSADFQHFPAFFHKKSRTASLPCGFLILSRAGG
ncbi:hypothetical protein, partial [Faecalibacterium sp. DFI.5.82]|uniref:hypothetical protein n=1 Tax=Faecalibacterium sp. DFI.5.82 TaxID=3031725 RepID=UPI0023B01088